MAHALSVSARRRFRNAAFTVIAAALFGWTLTVYGESLRQHKFLDGWVLVACILALAGFNLRKKLPMLPLGSAASWTRTHVYVGYFTVLVFLFHTDFSAPSGVLDWALGAMFVIVALSGVAGLFLSFAVPPKLEQSVERILLERIPGFRAQLAGEVQALAMQSVVEKTSLTLVGFYVDRLHDFMSGPADLMAHLRGSQRRLRRLCDEMEALRRYLDATGNQTLEEIKERVIAKDDLDFQYAHLRLLRLWLFVHVPATYSLVILIAVHVSVVYAYSSGAP
jgi:hypothetical protein